MKKLILVGLMLVTAAAGESRTAFAFETNRVDNSVVRVQRLLRQTASGKLRGFGHGTGFVIAPGIVVTNHHVIDTSKNKIPDGFTFHLVVPDGSLKTLRKVEIVWRSKPLDLAVLKVEGLDRPALEISALPPEQSPRKGEAVYAIGFPGASDNAMRGKAILETTQTAGIVGKIADASGPGGALRPVIQHSAQINPGNSGGPLFNECHQVIGVNTFIATSVFKLVKDREGKTLAVGAAVAGHFYSPHSINLVNALRSEKELAGLPVRIIDTTCTPETPGGIPVWTYIVIGVFAILAMTALGLAIFRKNTTREIVKVVESYSAWVRRKGSRSGPGEATMKPGAAQTMKPSAPPVAASPTGPTGQTQSESGWVLSGFDAEGHVIRISIGEDELKAATEGPDGGLIIGRSKSQASKIIGDGSVSRRHARVRLVDGKLSIEDLDSAFGTVVEGAKMEPGKSLTLDTGSKISLGQVTLEVSRS